MAIEQSSVHQDITEHQNRSSDQGDFLPIRFALLVAPPAARSKKALSRMHINSFACAESAKLTWRQFLPSHSTNVLSVLSVLIAHFDLSVLRCTLVCPSVLINRIVF